MTSLLIADIPEELLQRLRKKAKEEQTSIQEQIINILDQSLQVSPNFIAALDKYYEKYPRSERLVNNEEDPFANIRSQDPGREVKL
jgi:hypothetical protein